MARISTTLNDGKRATVIERDTSRDLAASETDAIILVASAIWAMRDPVLTDALGPTDALCSVALFDGEDVLHEFGAACPRPQFVQTLTTLAEVPR